MLKEDDGWMNQNMYLAQDDAVNSTMMRRNETWW
jgi:hypothetical protein